MKYSVFCMLTRYEQIEDINQDLLGAGISKESISIILADRPGEWDGVRGHSSEGAGLGAGLGAFVCGVSALAIPLTGPALGGGPLMAALAGIFIGGIIGGLAGGFIGIGLPEDAAHQLEGHINEGNAILSVHVDDKELALLAEAICRAHAGSDVHMVQMAPKAIKRAA